MTLASIRENFIRKFSFLESSAKILSRENFPLYGSMTCPSTGPCTISGLDTCVEYNLSAIPNNNFGSPTGCTGNSMVVTSQGQSYAVMMLL